MSNFDEALERFHQTDPDEEVKAAVRRFYRSIKALTDKLATDTQAAMKDLHGGHVEIGLVIRGDQVLHNFVRVLVDGERILDDVENGVRLLDH